MKGQFISGVLLLPCSGLSPENVRAAARHAGLALSLHAVANREAFFDCLRPAPVDLIIAPSVGLPDLGLRDLLDRAASAEPPIPVVVCSEGAREQDAVRFLSRGAAEVLQSRDLAHLPTVLARALKVRNAATQETRARQELDQTAAHLRENQKLITLGRLAASIAHEINNPLESITNLLFLLGEERDLSASARSYLVLAQRELERVTHISRQTLNFSRETTGPVRCRVDDLLEEVLSLYSRRIKEKNLSIQRQYQCPDEPVVYPGEMRQVLSNLITNAIEASVPNGRLRLRLRCTRAWSDPGVRGIRISIADNGSGIPPEVQRRLGEPFFTTKGQRGTGLGLWVTRSIVQRYGGEIQLRSSIDPRRHGTVFSIFLPTNLRPQPVHRPFGDPAPAAASSRTSSGSSASSQSTHRPTGELPHRRHANSN